MGKGPDIDIPTSYTITSHVDSNGTAFAIDADLDNIRIKEIAKIDLGDINVRLKELPPSIPKLTVDSNVAVKELPPIDTNISVKELPEIKVALTSIPDTRVHLPANFNVGFSMLGVCLFNVSLCGEAQIITEKYVPRRMELC